MKRAALLSLLIAGVAQARDRTYCVGGYSGAPPHVVAACNQPEVVRAHPKWHLHAWVTDGSACFICYDEVDTSCIWDFVKHHDGWRTTDPYRCPPDLSETGAHHIVEHVVDGQVVHDEPPRQATVLTPHLEQLPSTPLATGDALEAVGTLRDASGAIHPAAGGVFRFRDGSGRVTDVVGDSRPDGAVGLHTHVPPGTALTLEFAPVPLTSAYERLAATSSAPSTLKIEACPYHARLALPAAGAALAPGPVPLEAALVDRDGRVVASAGASLTFSIRLGPDQPLAITATGTDASWTAPTPTTSTDVSIEVSGALAGLGVCATPPSRFTLSNLGIAFDVSRLPRTCYVGVPCTGEAMIHRAPSSRADSFLADPQTQVRFDDTGDAAWTGPPKTDDRYLLSRTYNEVGERSWSLSASSAYGTANSEAVVVRVRPALQLRLASAIDFGVVAAGTATLASCRDLDFSQSVGAEEHGWSLEASGLGACEAHPVLAFRGPLGAVETRTLSPRLDIDALDPRREVLNLCLEVPRCAGETSPPEAMLTVTPRTPEFASQAARVQLHWSVTNRSRLACNAWWLLPLLSALAVLWLVAGVVRPARFTATASIRMAGSEKALKTAPATLLRDFPGSSTGFYRDARLGLRGDGSLTGSTAHAAVLFCATRRGCVLRGPGPLEVQERRTLRWEPVGDLPRGHEPASSALYRSGGTYFRIEAA